MLKITLKNTKNSFLLVAVLQLVIINSLAFSQNPGSSGDNKARNVILLVGDGMGIAQIHAAAANAQLNLLSLPHAAIVSTSSDDNDITDSGAGGTALATGVKTTNGLVGMRADSSVLKSILKIAEEYGLSTGLIATSDITHATPASFIANVPHRSHANEIARQFLDSGIDVFIGGGLNNFNKRADSINYIDSLITRGYYVATSLEQLKNHQSGKLAGLLYPEHPPKMSEGRGDMLSVSTSKALNTLSQNKDGFFLMIEGSQIDWGGHANEIGYVLAELLDFDKAVGIVLDFARSHPETLVIVTSDHETGGMTLIEDELMPGKMKPHFSTTHHSATPVPLFAFGKRAELFKGFMDNTDIFRNIMSAYGFKESGFNKRSNQ